MLRVIGGEFRGRKLRVPRSPQVRPTSSRTREAVFDIFCARAPFHGARFLDLFAGSGAVGIEALSRGAAFAEFVESDRGHIKTLCMNLEQLGLQERSLVTPGSLPRQREFDFIFADPPYAQKDADFSGLSCLLRPSGFFMLENEGDALEGEGMELVKSYRHGRARLHLYQRDVTEGK